MSCTRIGELLCRLVHLSNLDIEEILQEQQATHRKFGEAALALGLCRPEHVWNAWYSQLGERTPRIDLNDFGIDTQALTTVSRQTAGELSIIPLRLMGDQLVLAISEDSPQEALSELPGKLGKNIRFVLADGGQIREAIGTHYESSETHAAG